MELLKILKARADLLEVIIKQGRDKLTYSEASKVTGLKPGTLRSYASTGRIHSERIGRSSFLKIEALAELV